MKSSYGALRAAKITFLEACEIDRRTTFRNDRFFHLFSMFSRNAFLPRLNVHRAAQGPTLNRFQIFETVFGRPLGAPRGETGGPGAPQKSRRGARWATEGAEDLSESTLGAQMAFLAILILTWGKPTSGHKGPPKGARFFVCSIAVLGGSKIAQAPFSRRPDRPHNTELGSFWPLFGPCGSKKGGT